ncbi:winged helix-turn-helix domain-containing protein [Actinoallomurus sp. NPDC052274]|uniref:winged helix-turn-helix domain-containing protein n=1 Tax=Actinoallomurus sp. NPDC052274 TaxID=3155420 RepID=UPI00341D719E
MGEDVAYRLHFTAQDLARTRIADKAMPFLELHIAMRAVQSRTRRAALDAWRRSVDARLTAPARMALSLVPVVGYAQSLFPPTCAGDPEELPDRVLATPRAEIRAQMSAIAEVQPVPSWTQRLADDRALLKQLGIELRGLYDHLLGPYWANIEGLFAQDRAVRAQQWLTGGVERVLAEANPQWMRWDPPVLEIKMVNGAQHDHVLEGQGVLLHPSALCDRTIIDYETEPQPVITYPACGDDPLRRMAVLTPEPARARPGGAVAALLGQTRSSVLNVIAEHAGCSTKELADLAGVAPASASEHATVLREAGLIHTVRHRNTVRHSPTDLGIGLLGLR